MVVMGEGRIRQAAPPVEIYRQPADAFVADFIGSTNLIPFGPGGTLLGRPHPRLALAAGPGGAQLSLRPEDVRLVPPGDGAFPGTVTFVRDLGGTIETFVDVGGTPVVAVTTPRERTAFAAGDAVGVVLPVEACVVLKS